eukprot:COSAG02_NODE_6935_length_3280_cov_1.802263_1_plen_458_part_00
MGDVRAHGDPAGYSAVREEESIELALAPDSDAVECKFFAELRLLGKLLSSGPAAGKALLRVVQVLYAANLVLEYLVQTAISRNILHLEQPTSLMYVGIVLHYLGRLALLPLFGSAYAVLRPDGALARLGAGREKIGLAEARSLTRWRFVVAILSVVLALGCIVGLITAIAVSTDPLSEKILGVHPVLGGVSIVLNFPLVIVPAWWLSSQMGSCLARDRTLETIRQTLKADASDKPMWLSTVAQPALELEDTYHHLSAGWGMGFLAIVLYFWLSALSELCSAVDPVFGAIVNANQWQSVDIRAFNLVDAAFYAFVPFLLVFDIAATSSKCDDLITALNRVRIKHIKTGPHPHIADLEMALCKLNGGQGLGLVLSGVVVDRRTLKGLGLKLAGTFTTIKIVLISLGASFHFGEDGGVTNDASNTTCAYTPTQLARLQAAMVGRNATCFYNDTLQEILGM